MNTVVQTTTRMGRFLALAMLTLAMGAAAVAYETQGDPEVLTCDKHCSCWFDDSKTHPEYRVICNQTGSRPVMLTEAAFAKEDSDTNVYKTYVRVEDGRLLTITENFFYKWKEYGSCSLDLWRNERVVLPQISLMPTANSIWNHIFAGIGINGSIVDHVPRGLFSGKNKAGFQLSHSSVGIIESGLFSNVKMLGYFNVKESHIGNWRGSHSTDKLELSGRNDAYSIFFQNSVIGHIETGALMVSGSNRRDVYMDRVTIGELETGGIVVSKLDLVMNNSKVGDLQREALNVHESGSIIIQNSFLIAEAGALTHLPCKFYHHNIHSNEILVSSQEELSSFLDSQNFNQRDGESEGNSTSDAPKYIDLKKLVSEKLSLVLHKSCIEENLPQWIFKYNYQHKGLPKTSAKPSTGFLQTSLYSFVGITIFALLIVVVLACLLVNAKRHRSRRVGTEPVVFMSGLPQDPVYEDPTTLMIQPSCPPPLPPPVPLDSCGNSYNSNNCSATFDRRGNSCNTAKRKESNDYMVMK